jgi:hypothetical protein
MTLAIDFDGVLHSYSKGWNDGTIYDSPVPGAMDALHRLMRDHAVFILTARHTADVAKWLEGHGFTCTLRHDGKFWNRRGVLLVTDRKLPAAFYIDDRALRFTSWRQTLAVIANEAQP